MMTRRTIILLAVLPLCGCLTTPRISPVRLFPVEPQMNISAVESTALTLGVRPLLVARPYKSQMAYLDETQAIGYRVNEEWAENPGDIVTRAVLDALAATHRFQDAGNAADMARPDLIMTGEVRKFHENRNANPRTADVEVRFELREARENGSLWAATLSAQAPMEGDSAADLAQAMGRAVGRVVEMATEAIVKTELPVQPAP